MRNPALLTLLLLAAHGAPAQQPCDGVPDSRWRDNGDGTVTDPATRLMWLRCSAGQTSAPAGCAGTAQPLSWPDARSAAADINRRGSFFYNDWRLPQLRELATIAERRCQNPRIHPAAFPATPVGAYWTQSARPRDESGDFAYTLSFGSDGVGYVDRQELHFVRLVRDAR